MKELKIALRKSIESKRRRKLYWTLPIDFVLLCDSKVVITDLSLRHFCSNIQYEKQLSQRNFFQKKNHLFSSGVWSIMERIILRVTIVYKFGFCTIIQCTIVWGTRTSSKPTEIIAHRLLTWTISYDQWHFLVSERNPRENIHQFSANKNNSRGRSSFPCLGDFLKN